MGWQIVGDTFTLFGTGHVPRIVGGTPDPPPVTPPPVVPPVVPPAPPVVDDTSPFLWPPQPRDADYPDERWEAVGQNFYVAQAKYRNPLPGSNWYAGRIAPGVILFGREDVGGFALWAPRDADPAAIRRALRTGRPS